MCRLFAGSRLSFTDSTSATAFSSSPPPVQQPPPPHLTHPPHWLPRGSPLQEHHVTTLTPASPRPQAGPRTPWACTEGGRRGSSKTRVPRTSKRPEGRVLSVSSKNEEQVSFNLFQFTQLQFRISAVISLHSLIFLCLFFFLSFLLVTVVNFQQLRNFKSRQP